MGLAVCPGPGSPGVVPSVTSVLQPYPEGECVSADPQDGGSWAASRLRAPTWPWEVGLGSACLWESWTTASGRPKGGWRDPPHQASSSKGDNRLG